MINLKQTVVLIVVVATTMPSGRQNAPVTSTDRHHRRHKEESTTHATVALPLAPVHGRAKPTDRSKPGIVDMIRALSGDSQV